MRRKGDARNIIMGQKPEELYSSYRDEDPPGRFTWLTVLHIAFTSFLAVLAIYQWFHILQLQAGCDGVINGFDQETITPKPLNNKGSGSYSDTEIIKSLQVRIERKDLELEGLRKQLKESDRRIRKAEKTAREGTLPEEGVAHQTEKLKRRVSLFQKKISRIETSLQQSSKELLQLKFGKPPYYAKVTVRFPTVMGQPEIDSFKIELAPSDLMPYSVHLWLSQVKGGLWNGCSFIRNANHVLQASPRTMQKESLIERFHSSKNIERSLAFQEYHREYPHEKYTLGFAGRPGGPDFYISLVDNSKNHGPGGQTNYEVPEEADSCFGRVVEGFDVISRMHSAKAEQDSFQSLVAYIGIEKIEIL